MRVDLTRHFHRDVVAIVAAAHRAAERIGVLVGALAAIAAGLAGTLAYHAVLLHLLRQSLRALAHGLQRAALAVDRAVGVALAELTFGLAHGIAGAAARDALYRHNGDFDLLLTDVKMPRMDGIALAMAAGRGHPGVAIMLMTGYADQRERTHGLGALVHDVIAKPFSVEQIKGAVREALIER